MRGLRLFSSTIAVLKIFFISRLLTSSPSALDTPSLKKNFKANISTYEPAATDEPYGSTEFDYDGSTPDPNDDCATIIVGDDPDNGSNHAFVHKNPEAYEKLMVFYEGNHQQFLSELLPTQWVTEREFTVELAEKEDDSFNNAFPEEK